MLELRIVTVFVLCFETCNIESPGGTGFNPHASIFAVKLRKTIRTGPPLILERGRPVEITVARDCKRWRRPAPSPGRNGRCTSEARAGRNLRFRVHPTWTRQTAA